MAFIKKLKKASQLVTEKGGIKKVLNRYQTDRLITEWHYAGKKERNPYFDLHPEDTLNGYQPSNIENFNDSRWELRRQFKEDIKIGWVLPYFYKGGGGHFNIFRCQTYLKKLFGIHSANFFYPSPVSPKKIKKLERAIEARALEYYAPDYVDAPVCLDWKQLSNFQVHMATTWMSTYPIIKSEGALLKSYFIQDYEKCFYPEGARRELAERTYDFGLFPICAGPWLPEVIGFSGEGSRSREHVHYNLAADSKDYFFTNLSPREGVCFYVRLSTDRRAFELVHACIAYLQKTSPELKIFTVGMNGNDLSFMRNVYHYGVKDISELQAIYSIHKAYVTPSATNYSLLPAEIQACGGRVLDLDLPCNRKVKSLFSDNQYFLCEMDPIKMADAVRAILSLPEVEKVELTKLDWTTEYSKVGNAILRQFGR